MTDLERLFDPNFYLQQNADVRASLLSPLQHYLDYGWREGRAPNRWFNERHYLAALGPAGVGGISPFLHWVDEGRLAGVSPGPGAVLTREGTVVLARGHEGCADCAVMSGAFDARYYAYRYRDIPSPGGEVDLLAHFCAHGWKERRNPSPRFDVAAYFAFYPDVLEANINPFSHFLRHGRAEGRVAESTDGTAAWLMDHAVPAAARLRVPPPPPSERLKGALRAHVTDAVSRVGTVVCFGPDVYVRHLGGIQLFTLDEQRLCNERGLTYLHLSPAVPLLAVRTGAGASLPGMVAVTLDGRYLGVAEMDEVLAEVPWLAREGAPRWAAVHGLLGFNADALAERLAGTFQQVFYWLHDFHSACPGLNLLRNDAVHCGLPAPGARACDVCIYGPERAALEPAVARFFERVRPVVASPSEHTLALWLRAGRATSGARVVPHWTLEPAASGPPGLPDDARPLRVAFLGHPSAHKGWRSFLRLVDRCAHLPEYEFWHLGAAPGEDGRVRFARVEGSAADRDAMLRVLGEVSPDVAFLYSIWPETYSYTLHESLLAGVRVICHADSGNIRAQVEALRAGLVFPSEDALVELFDQPVRLREALSACPRPAFRRTGQGTTASLIEVQ